MVLKKSNLKGPKIKQLLVFTALALMLDSAFAQQNIPSIFVGNNKSGTISIINAKTLEIEKTIDVAPDKNDSVKQPLINRVVNYMLGPKYVDDIDLLPDGKTLIISRPYFSDIAAFDINSGKMLWNLYLDHRPDHQVITKDGKYLFVSLLVSKKGVKIDLTNREIVGYFKAGRRPHSIVLNKDETKVYNGSLKGNDIVVVDTESLVEVDRLKFPQGVRPFKIDAGEEFIYAQLSYCHCIVKYDIAKKEVIQKIDLPIPASVKDIELDDYPFEAAHHGIGFSGDRTFISLAGTISNYTAILTFPEFELVKILETGMQPSWITSGFDEDRFFVSARESDNVYVVSYSQQKIVKEIPVGDFPQRMARGIWIKD